MTDYSKLTDTEEFQIAKPFMAVAAGNAVFFLLFFIITPILAKLGITPYGEFSSTFFEGRNTEEATAYIKANREAYDIGLLKATWFINIFVAPVLAILLGVVTGGIMAKPEGEKQGFLNTGFGAGFLALAAIIPALFQLIAQAWGDPRLSIYLFIIASSAAIGGVIGNHLAYPFLTSLFSKGNSLKKR